ncbi:MAG: hypothetical protein KKA19_06600 [Candidatus Margulisbacteria bacterium]|nr:hypothetical protein [Candidatus Margulisiibacteriota bacterium]
MGILLVEITILLTIAFFYFYTQKQISVLDRIIGASMLVIATGLPIIFTSITRSVFEVTKLLVMRLGLIAIITAWLSKLIIEQRKSLLFNEEITLPDQKIFNFSGLKWIQTGIEWPLLAWIISNILSTFITPAWPITIIGAYDRWEGIYLVMNYILLLWIFTKFSQKRQFFYWMFGSLLITACLSSIYGIFQSRGIDFMRWSVDPTARVFASINNPVHFSAYVIMLVPLTYGWILFLLSTKAKEFSFRSTLKEIFILLKNSLNNKKIPQISDPELRKNLGIIIAFISMIIILYTGNVLSYGRATWVGFIISTSYVFYLITRLNNTKNFTTLLLDFLSFTMLLAFFILIFIFKAYLLSKTLNILIFSGITIAIIFNFLLTKDIKNLLLRLTIIFYGVQLPFSTVGIVSILWILLCLVIYAKLTPQYIPQKNIQKYQLYLLITFFLTVCIPSLPTIYQAETYKFSNWFGAKFKTQVVENTASTTAIFQTERFSSQLLGGAARLSMWKSGLVWVNTYPIFGTGPGTIKEMYPVFRRSDYGRLEGGQNFTPDKLHNEYINVMATNGYTGFIIYFLWLIPAFFWIVISTISKNRNAPSSYLIIGLLGGCFVYWGQTLFNFGVVATKGLFYILMGLTLAITIHNPWKDFPDTIKNS